MQPNIIQRSYEMPFDHLRDHQANDARIREYTAARDYLCDPEDVAKRAEEGREIKRVLGKLWARSPRRFKKTRSQ
jgi:hypothetical protein